MSGSDQERVIEEREKQRKHDFHTTNVSRGAQNGAMADFEEEKAKYLDKLMQTEMSDAGIDLLDNMVDRAFILGNISAAEYHDLVWEIHGLWLKIKAAFPPKASDMQGELRAYILDDPDEALTALSDQQRTIIAQMLRGLALLASRSKEGFQQEMNVKSITVSEVLNPEDDDEDKLLKGLFS